MLTDEPAWLVAWREGRTAPAAPAQRGAQPLAGVAQGGSRAKPQARAANGANRGSSGFTEPGFEAWRFDGCKRREPVLDLDHNPPLVVRKVGWRVCMCCVKPFWSENVIAVRLCHGCKETHDRRAGVARGGAG